MDVRKTVYTTNGVYFGKVEAICFTGSNDLTLLAKYPEPEVEAGGTITDGTTSYSLTSVNKKIYSQSPFLVTIDPVSLSIDYVEAGKRTSAYCTVMYNRIYDAMIALRATDSTSNYDLVSIKTV